MFTKLRKRDRDSFCPFIRGACRNDCALRRNGVCSIAALAIQSMRQSEELFAMVEIMALANGVEVQVKQQENEEPAP